MAERYVVLGFGKPRATWLREVSQWTTSGAIPGEFLKCLTAGEVHQRLSDLRPYSAILIEVGTAGLDRDLIDHAKQSGVAVIIVGASDHEAAPWIELGASTALATITPLALLNALATHANTISVSGVSINEPIDDLLAPPGKLIAVCGPGGTGASTVAIALAQGLSTDPLNTGMVLLADLARHAEQAMLHNSGDVIPGIEELVEISRQRRPTIEQVHSLTFAFPSRGYALLLGQRRPQAWTSMPPRAIEVALLALQRTYRFVVADITADFETEQDAGSLDVEERNGLALAALRTASAVIAVGSGDMKGIHALARTIRDLVDRGVPRNSVVSIVNRAPRGGWGDRGGRGGRAKTEITKALAALVPSESTDAISPPLFIPERPIDAALRDMAPLPKQLAEVLTAAVEAHVARQSRPPVLVGDHTPVIPGTLFAS